MEYLYLITSSENLRIFQQDHFEHNLSLKQYFI